MRQAPLFVQRKGAAALFSSCSSPPGVWFLVYQSPLAMGSGIIGSGFSGFKEIDITIFTPAYSAKFCWCHLHALLCNQVLPYNIDAVTDEKFPKKAIILSRLDDCS